MRKAAALASLFFVVSAAVAQDAERLAPGKPAPEPVAADPAELAATAEISARAVQAIPLFRTVAAPGATSEVRILPFIDAEGAPIAIGKPLLAFQILPFPDEHGRHIPILRDGLHILPFVDESGEPIVIRHPRVREPETP